MRFGAQRSPQRRQSDGGGPFLAGPEQGILRPRQLTSAPEQEQAPRCATPSTGVLSRTALFCPGKSSKDPRSKIRSFYKHRQPIGLISHAIVCCHRSEPKNAGVAKADGSVLSSLQDQIAITIESKQPKCNRVPTVVQATVVFARDTFTTTHRLKKGSIRAVRRWRNTFNMAASKRIASIRRLEEEVDRISEQQTEAMRTVTSKGMTVRQVKEYCERHRRIIHMLRQMATLDKKRS
jgi:hypothetical protein